MKKYLQFVRYLGLALSFVLLGVDTKAQTSTNRVNYEVTFSTVTNRFTVWVVPQYSTPNANNPDTDERGGTALVTLKVPTAFTISDIQSQNGNWETNPTKLGPGIQAEYSGQGLDPNFQYYSIGKSTLETNYGPFSLGVRVPLFSFAGNGTQGGVSVLLATDPFVTVSDQQLSLNVTPSFYSRSGQPAGGNQVPLEQFQTAQGNPANFIRANDDTFTGIPGSVANHVVLTNDNFNGGIPTSSQVVLSIVGGTVLNGTATVQPNGTVNFTPNVGFSGVAGYTYQICDALNPTICETAQVTVNVNCSVIASPTVANLTLCQNQTANPLTASVESGLVARWYTASTGGSGSAVAPTPVTSSVGSQSFWVSALNTSTGCESPRVQITVTINATPVAPAVTTPLAYCQGQSAIALTATGAAGTTLLWYANATGGTGNTTAPVPSTAVVGSMSYFVSAQNANGCESPRSEIIVNTQAIPGIPTVSTPLAYCVGQTAPALTATPSGGFSLRWYTSAAGGVGSPTAPTPTTTAAGTQSYWVSTINSSTSCESARVRIDVIVQDAPAIPTGNTTLSYCQNAPAVALAATAPAGTTLRWYTVAVAGSPSTVAPTPSTATIGTQSFWVSSFNSTTGCESTRLLIQVQITDCRAVLAIQDQMVTSVNQAVSLNVIQNDLLQSSVAPLVAQTMLITAPANGNVTLTAAGVATYTPNAGFTGSDSFQYRVCDSGTPSVCDEGVARITVLPVIIAGQNNAPIALADAYSGMINQTITGNVSSNDSDPDAGQTLSYSVVQAPANGTLTLNSNGTFTFVPSGGFTGETTFRYQVCDNGSPVLCAEAFAQIVVKAIEIGVNQAPVVTQLYARTNGTTPVVRNLVPLVSDPEGTPLVFQTTLVSGPTNGVATLTAGGQLTYTANPNFVGTDQLVYRVCDSGSPAQCTQSTVIVEVFTNQVRVAAKAYLQGALLGVTGPTGLMRDDLRVKNLLPTTSPYTQFTPLTPTGTVNASVFTTTGANAIVDWVYMELRSSADSRVILDSRAALLQRDGDVVDLDGTSPVSFSSSGSGNYFVSIRHRNHLGVMTAQTVALSSVSTLVDFTLASTQAFVPVVAAINVPRVVVDQGVALWAGNVSQDDRIIYQGSQNDIEFISTRVLNASLNILNSPVFKLRGYFSSDVNMDGETILQGQNNDPEFIYLNIIKNHPGNSLKQNGFVIREQLP